MRTREDAIMFRAGIVRRLAEKRPDLCDESGQGFWPIPVMIPVVLAKCLYLIHDEWLKQIQASNDFTAALLTEIRMRLTHLLAEGDCGEDHAGIYMREHPTVKEIQMASAPFFQAYQAILNEEDPFVLLGFIYSIEVGSLEAIKALVASRMIVNKTFAELHMVEEVEHEKIAEEMKQCILDPKTFAALHMIVEVEDEKIAEEIERLISESKYASRFAKGCDLHDQLYEEIVV